MLADNCSVVRVCRGDHAIVPNMLYSALDLEQRRLEKCLQEKH